MTEIPTLICLVGRKGAGKDTAASVLTAQGYANVKFAGALKDMIRALLAYQGVDDDTIERMVEGDLKEVATPYLAGKTPRFAMQTLGTEWGRYLIGEGLWTDAAISRSRLHAKTVITDGRFPNELEAVETEGGVNIGITADWITPTEGEHESERLIDDLISSFPENHRLVNHRVKPGEDVGKVIQHFQYRFLALLHTLEKGSVH